MSEIIIKPVISKAWWGTREWP